MPSTKRKRSRILQVVTSAGPRRRVILGSELARLGIVSPWARRVDGKHVCRLETDIEAHRFMVEASTVSEEAVILDPWAKIKPAGDVWVAVEDPSRLTAVVPFLQNLGALDRWHRIKAGGRAVMVAEFIGSIPRDTLARICPPGCTLFSDRAEFVSLFGELTEKGDPPNHGK